MYVLSIFGNGKIIFWKSKVFHKIDFSIFGIEKILKKKIWIEKWQKKIIYIWWNENLENFVFSIFCMVDLQNIEKIDQNIDFENEKFLNIYILKNCKFWHFGIIYILLNLKKCKNYRLN